MGVKIKRFEFGMQGTNCYVIYNGGSECAVIDCDVDRRNQLAAFLEENGLKPTYILLTHGHGDHIGAVESVREKYGCKVCIGEREADVLLEPEKNLSGLMGGEISIVADKLLKNGEILKVGDMGFEVILTPGHTHGSVCYIIEDNIISGDTLFAGSCGRTDFVTGNWEEIVKSLKTLGNMEGDYNVFPGHGPSTTLEYERKNNPFMK